MNKPSVIAFLLTISILFSCIFPERHKAENTDSFSNVLDKYFALKEESDRQKDTTDFSKLEISEDSLDVKLYNLLDSPGDMDEALLLKNIENLVQRGANPNAMLEVSYSVRKPGTYIPIIKHFYQDKYREYTMINSPMHAAVANGKVPIVEKLVSLGGNPNLFNQDKVYLIDIALKSDNLQMVDCLIAHGCKVSNANLSMSQNTELIERLVKSGANPKTIDINYALTDRAKLKRLLALKPSLTDIKLDMEIVMKDDELFDLLIANGLSPNVKGRFPNECPILFSAIMYGNMHAFKKLYEMGADLKENCRYGFAETPFQAAIYYQQIEIIVFLLEHKISPNEKDWTGKSALILACNGDNDQIINLLLDKGAELEYSGYFGNTPLLYSVQYQHYISVETLIKRKANVNFKSNYGETALTLAIANNDYAMIKLLIESGANPKIKYESKNLVEYAQEKEASPAVVHYLKNLIEK